MRWAADPKRSANYAAAAFAVAGPITLVGAIANGPRYEALGGSAAPILVASIGAIAVALIIPFLPWARWGTRATLVLPALAVAMLVAAEVGSKSSRSVDGVMSTSSIITMIFVWIGLTQPRWASLLVAPFVSVAMCLAFAAEEAAISVTTTIVSVVLAAMIGELIAWVKHADQVRSTELGLVIDGSNGLRLETDSRAAADRVVETVTSLLGVPNVAVYLDSDTGQCTLAARSGDREWPPVLETDDRSLVSVTESDDGFVLTIPLIGRSGQLHGAAVAVGRRRQDEFMVRLAQILGEQAGSRLDDLATMHALADETRRDALTGIGNRRFADETLRTLRAGDVIAVVDLDDLRAINAQFGHHGGDEAIQAVARYLSDAIRAGDAVARLGGDEFVMVLRRAGPGAFPLLERITDDWNQANPDATITAGAAIYSAGAPDTVLREADRALFAAKYDGKARVNVATELGPVSVADAVGL